MYGSMYQGCQREVIKKEELHFVGQTWRWITVISKEF